MKIFIVGNSVEKKEEKEEEHQDCLEHDHGHEHKSGNRSAFLYLFADFLHNAVDGLAIGISFNISKIKSQRSKQPRQ